VKLTIHPFLVHMWRMSGVVPWGFSKEKLFIRETSHEFETRGMVVELCRESEEQISGFHRVLL